MMRSNPGGSCGGGDLASERFVCCAITVEVESVSSVPELFEAQRFARAY
jgi:hypothetical protein